VHRRALIFLIPDPRSNSKIALFCNTVTNVVTHQSPAIGSGIRCNCYSPALTRVSITQPDPRSYWVGCMRNHPQNRIRDQ